MNDLLQPSGRFGSATGNAALQRNKVLRNTYGLLAITLAFSGLVAQQRVPLPIQHDGGIRLVVLQGELQGTAHAGHVVITERAMLEHRRQGPTPTAASAAIVATP